MSGYRPTVTLDTTAPVVFADKIPDPTVAKPRRRKDSGVGARLQQLREDAGLTQAEVARRMGTDPANVWQIEHGRMDPRLSTVLRFAAALGARVHIGLINPAHAEPTGPKENP